MLQIKINKIVAAAMGREFQRARPVRAISEGVSRRAGEIFLSRLGTQGGGVRSRHRNPVAAVPRYAGRRARSSPGATTPFRPGRLPAISTIATWSKAPPARAGLRARRAGMDRATSHAAQGNGEVNLTALETAFQEINVTITRRQDAQARMAAHRDAKRLDHDGLRRGSRQSARRRQSGDRKAPCRAAQDPGRAGMPTGAEDVRIAA